MSSAKYSSVTQVDIRPPISQLQPAPSSKHEAQDWPYKHGDQLQFNLCSPTRNSNLQTTFRKPRPIIIEKLAPAPNDFHLQRQRIRTSSSSIGSLSNERLEFAVKLAKRDVKKLKSMLSDPGIDVAAVLKRMDDGEPIQRETSPSKEMHANDVSAQQPHVNIYSDKNKVSMKGKERFAAKRVPPKQGQKEKNKNTRLEFYKPDGDIVGEDDDARADVPQGKELTEIKRLRKELQKYMKRLESLMEEKTSSSQNEKPREKLFMEEETEKKKKVARAGEQAARSARVLYMLQRKIKEIQDEIEKKDEKIKHTKKSQHLGRLAAAHRSAVRALQMFVNQAPLYFDIKHGLPPMYQELGLLIQQLSLLSSQLEIGKGIPEFDLDLLPRTKNLISKWNEDTPKKSHPPERKRIQGKQNAKDLQLRRHQPKESRKCPSSDQSDGWVNNSKKSVVIDSNSEVSDASNEPTPEREAVLKAGLDALERARHSTSVLETVEDVRTKPGGVSFQIPRQTNARTKQKSVLFPHQIKKHRMRSTTSIRKPTKAARTVGDSRQPMHFAQQTVASILKKQNEIKYEARRRTPSSPNHQQSMENVRPKQDTPRQRDEKILHHLSPSSKRSIPRSNANPAEVKKALNFDNRANVNYDNDVMEREIARQAWLDREREREIHRLEDLRRKETNHLQGLRYEYANSQQLINDAEERIKKKLQPLLEKAEFISIQEKLREDEYKNSVKRRLGDIVSETALSKGELLADMILEDILTETVLELQRIEQEESAEVDAAFAMKEPDMETVKQKLAEFEMEEEQIRRRWKTLHYSELDVMKDTDAPNSEARRTTGNSTAKPIVFTSTSDSQTFNKQKDYSGNNDFPEKQPNRVRFYNLDDRRTVSEFVPMELRASIMAYKSKYERYLKHTMTEEHGSFNPWELIDRISESILDDVITEVGEEMTNACDDYVERIYADEFVKNDSLFSETSNETFSR